MMDDMNKQQAQINVKQFNLQPPQTIVPTGSKSMMVKKGGIGSGIGSGIGGGIGSGIGSGIGGGLRKPTALKQPSAGSASAAAASAGITGSRVADKQAPQTVSRTSATKY